MFAFGGGGAGFVTSLSNSLTSSPTDEAAAAHEADILMNVLGMGGIGGGGGRGGRLGFDFKCSACKYGIDLLMDYYRTGASKNVMLKTLSVFCTLFGIQAKPICNGYVKNYGRQLFGIFANDVDRKVGGSDICAIALRGKCELTSERLNNWSLNDIPDLDNPPQATPKQWPRPHSSRQTQKVLHLTDIHLQLGYTVGANANCGLPMCCDPSVLEADQEFKNMTKSLKMKPASPVGEYHCDLPTWTAAKMLRNIRETHPDIAFILVTGDFPGHGTWHQNRTENLESTAWVVQLVKDVFSEVPVFPNIGNHESFPVNLFPDSAVTGEFSPKWLYKNLAKLFKDWLPNQQQQSTLLDGGYYSVLVREGLRIISVNTNFCNNFNFWLALNFDDPHQHLHWIYKELQRAEQNGESVYMVGHIPPGSSSCTGRWSEEYTRLVTRFRHTIAAQFFGHTHNDEFKVFVAEDPQAPDRQRIATSIAYVGPSQTPIDGLNPSYRIYTIDAGESGNFSESTNYVLDHETFWMDLVSAQQSGEVAFQPLYKAKEVLGTEELRAQDWYDYAVRMSKQRSLFAEFRQRWTRNGPATRGDFTDAEWKAELCKLVTSWSIGGAKNPECKRLEANVDGAKPKKWWEFFIDRL